MFSVDLVYKPKGLEIRDMMTWKGSCKMFQIQCNNNLQIGNMRTSTNSWEPMSENSSAAQLQNSMVRLGFQPAMEVIAFFLINNYFTN